MGVQRFQRQWLHGSVDLMVLSVFSDGAQYGYAIQKRVAEASAGRVKLTAGTLYPLLHRLEADRLIRSRWDRRAGRPRKWYELTAAGRKRLADQSRQWHEFTECVGRLLEGSAATPAPRRA
jgi:DNA-binding PadR family transcriptional regulator